MKIKRNISYEKFLVRTYQRKF